MSRCLFHGAAAGLAAALVVPDSAPARTRVVTIYSPPVHVARYGVQRDSSRIGTPRLSGSIVAMSAAVVDPQGRVVPQNEVMLHHVVYFNRGTSRRRRRDGSCPHRPVGERFFGTSEELRDLTLPQGYGYPIARTERWASSWMLMNHTATPRAVRLRARVVVDDNRALRRVKPYWASIVPCVPDPQYTVPGGAPPGAEHVARVAWRVPVSGRVVAAGGHLHGGARSLELNQPACGNRTLVRSQPYYGQPDHPVYAVTPLLHEPDPLNISWWQSPTGIPVRKGERLEVAAHYDASRAHTRVMGIGHIYLAPGRVKGPRCAPLPGDATVLGPNWRGRTEPPPVALTLAQVGPDGIARSMDLPAGASERFDAKASVQVRDTAFRPARLSVRRGGVVSWRFVDGTDHDATSVSGPVGFASPWSERGDVYRRRFAVPGTYRLHCSLHPARMSQVVEVR